MRMGGLFNKFTHAVNRHNANAVAALCAPNAVAYDPMYPQPLKGKEAIRKDFKAFVKAFPDLRMTVGRTLTKGKVAAAEVTYTGTNTGALVTPASRIPPTKKRMELRAAGFVRVNAQGLVVEIRRYYDTGALMQQLGLKPDA